ncbi:hypothetical protein EV195_107244 [Tenacibaculum skagerrakense]|uniref:Uncharacterized protein n=1 Tax=Tenacibaculum skagerrakense TaxID=186571 RepID=A0A4R2NQM5_9FLAO|nr:hypothetical protein EV195_107244 [Tenacibaculum skagerrakense]
MVIVGIHNRRCFHWVELYEMIQVKWTKIKLTKINSPEFMSVKKLKHTKQTIFSGGFISSDAKASILIMFMIYPFLRV